MNFLGALLTPETNNRQYKKPPDFTFCYGYFIRRCVLENLEIKIEQYSWRLRPVRTHFILQVRQVSP
jgi:hypothetical protein